MGQGGSRAAWTGHVARTSRWFMVRVVPWWRWNPVPQETGREERAGILVCPISNTEGAESLELPGPRDRGHPSLRSWRGYVFWMGVG